MRDRIRYTAFFSLLAALCVYYWLAVASVARWLLLWPTLSCGVMALAYVLHRPGLVAGKSITGKISIPLVLVNLPWLAFTWLVWLMVVPFSKEPNASPITGTNLSISRYPLFGVDLAGFDCVFDLTAEFPCLYRSQGRYQCLPSLDGIALGNAQLLPKLNPQEKVLIHCAQGHGRSATFASLLLSNAGLFATPQLAHEAILASRPGAKLAKSQLRQLLYCAVSASDNR